ncbi:unnamed protein product, partial [Meganyctiphanes norvegica]
MVANNLNLMHAARKAYIESESSEKLRRALRHQIRPSLAQKYSNGDLVYYKRNESARWMGPGTVIGWETKQVLVKHGSTYVRVHPCRLARCSPDLRHSLDASSAIDCSETENTFKGIDRAEVLSETEDMDDEGVIEMDNGQVENLVIREEQNAGQVQELPATTVSKSLRLSDLPKPGQIVHCRLSDGNDLDGLKVISRAGKATGSNKYFMNVVQGNNRPFCLDFENAVNSWRAAEDLENQDEDAETFLLSTSDPSVEQAKQKELSSWIGNNVYTVVPDVGKSRITTRWICGEKTVQGNKVV